MRADSLPNYDRRFDGAVICARSCLSQRLRSQSRAAGRCSGPHMVVVPITVITSVRDRSSPSLLACPANPSRACTHHGPLLDLMDCRLEEETSVRARILLRNTEAGRRHCHQTFLPLQLSVFVRAHSQPLPTTLVWIWASRTRYRCASSPVRAIRKRANRTFFFEGLSQWCASARNSSQDGVAVNDVA